MLKLLLFGCLFIASAAYATEESDLLYTQAMQAKKMEQFDLVIEKLEQATKIAPQNAQLWLELGRIQGYKQRYNEALLSLNRAASLAPDNLEINFARAQIYTWQKDDLRAEKELSIILSKHPDDYDAILQKARLHYYQHDYRNATNSLRELLKLHPDNKEILIELAKIKAAQGYLWQLNTGYEYSNLSNTTQPNWQQQFTQLSYKYTPHTILHARIDRIERFDNIDSSFEAGINYTISNPLSGYLYGALAPDATFLPNWVVLTGGEYRVFDKLGWLNSGTALLDFHYDSYEAADITTVIPGWRQYVRNDLYLTAQPIILHDDSGYLYGWRGKIDMEATDKLHLYAGLSNAPETVAAITVRTASVFAGMGYRINDRLNIRVDYTHDDRANSYIRDAVSSSVTFSF